MSGFRIIYWGQGNPLSRLGTRTRHDHILVALRKRPEVEQIHYVDTPACLQFHPQPGRKRSQVIGGEGPDPQVLAPLEMHTPRNRVPFTQRFAPCRRLALRSLAKQVERSIESPSPLIWWICSARSWPVLEYAASTTGKKKAGILDCV